MIIGIGIDSVEIARFNNWHTYSQKKLGRIFSPHEIEYCLSNQAKAAERFAGRFAAREALYKALPFPCEPFITFCQKVTIHNGTNGKPNLQLNNLDSKEVTIHISMTHTKDLATALVILEKVKK